MSADKPAPPVTKEEQRAALAVLVKKLGEDIIQLEKHYIHFTIPRKDNISSFDLHCLAVLAKPYNLCIVETYPCAIHICDKEQADELDSIIKEY